MIRIGRKLCGAYGALLALATLSLIWSGCSSRQSSQQALDAQLQSLHLEKADLGKFAGKVTIDGSPPKTARGKVLLVILYDPAHPDKNKPPIQAACKPDGSFSFFTYSANDGVAIGKYVVLFAQLMASRGRGLVQPDGLKNLYDDPDKNSEDKDFVVTVTQSGKTDYNFNLEIAGKDPVTSPGPHAITEIRKD